MNVKEMFIDSIKYSINGKWEFLFLGLLLSSLSTILYFIGTFPFSSLLLVPWILFFLIEGGYLANIIEDTIWGLDSYPKFENFKDLIWKGIKELFIFIIYGLIPLFVLILLLFDIIIFDVDIPTLGLFILFVVSLFFSVIVVQGAIIHYEYNHSKFKTAFELKKILGKLRRMGVGKFISSFFMVFLISLLVEPTIAEFSQRLHPLIGIFLEFTLFPFITILTARFTGLIGRYHFKEN